MKILMFSDYHIDPNAEYSRDSESGYTTYLDDCLKSCKWLLEVAEANTVDAIFFLGDFFHNYTHLDPRSLNVGWDIYRSLTQYTSRRDIPFRMLLGNHDLYRTKSKLSSMRGFLEKNPNILYTGLDEELLTTKSGDLRVLYIPYGVEEEAILAKDYSSGEFDLALMHVDFVGAQMHGRSYEGGLDPNVLPCRAFAGHFHLPSKHLTPQGTEITVVGSLLARNYADQTSLDSPARGALIYDTECQDYIRFKNPHAKIYLNLNEEQLPKFKELYRDTSNVRMRLTSTSKLSEQSSSIIEELESVSVSVLQEEVLDRSPLANFQDPQKVLIHWIKTRGSQFDAVKLWSLLGPVPSNSQKNLRKVKFTKLKIEGYASIGSIELDLAEPGLRLLRGKNLDGSMSSSNGSGKSSIFQALEWCIYGKTSRSLTQKQIINRNLGYVAVSLGLEVDGQAYTLQRSIDHPELGSCVSVYVDSSSVEDRKPEANKRFKELLDISQEHFNSSFVLNPYGTNLTSMNDKSIKALLSLMSNSSVYEQLSENIKNKQAKNKEDIAKLEGKISYINQLLAEDLTLVEPPPSLDVDPKALMLRIKELSEEEETRRKKLEDKVGELQPLREKLVKLTSRIKELVSNRDSVQARLASLSGEVAVCSECGSELDNPKELREKYQSYLDKVIPAIESYQEKEAKLTEYLQQEDQKIGPLDLSDLDEERETLTDKLQLHLREAGHRSRYEAFLREKDKRAKLEEEKETLYEEVLTPLEEEGDMLKWWYDRGKGALSSSGIIAYVNDSIINQVNKELKLLQSYLCPDYDLLLSPTSPKGKDAITLYISGEDTLATLSSGQRKRVDIALQLAINAVFSKTLVDLNLLVCDEVDSNLDSPGMLSLKEVLLDLAQEKSIFLVSHHPALDSIVENVIEVVKEAGISNLAS